MSAPKLPQIPSSHPSSSPSAPQKAVQPHRHWIVWLSSVLGLGYLPLMPGTWGTLAALPLWWLCASWPIGQQLAGLCILTLLAVWITHRAEQYYDHHDASAIVIDELVGMLWASVALPWHGTTVCLSFVCFRLLDMTKPLLIGWIDRHVPGAWGVVLDDVVAGACSLVLVHGLRGWGGW